MQSKRHSLRQITAWLWETVLIYSVCECPLLPFLPWYIWDFFFSFANHKKSIRKTDICNRFILETSLVFPLEFVLHSFQAAVFYAFVDDFQQSILTIWNPHSVFLKTKSSVPNCNLTTFICPFTILQADFECLLSSGFSDMLRKPWQPWQKIEHFQKFYSIVGRETCMCYNRSGAKCLKAQT